MKNNDLGLENTANLDMEKISFNHSYWESNAEKFKTDHTVSWGDINMINLEVRNISKYVRDGDFVLDAGCSNGFSTFKVADKKNIKVRAFDYSKKSIDYALVMQKEQDGKKKIEFYHANILDIPEKGNTFDKAYTIRVVINLLSWELQKQAILEVHRILKPGGLYIMSEAFVGGLKNINDLRKMAGMSPLTVHDFNLYLEEEKVENFVKGYFDILEIKKFSSIYYVASRFLRYLTMKKGEKDSFINEINNMFAKYDETESSGDFGVQKIYVLRKKN